MDDLVAALHLLAEKLRVDVNELSNRFVLYTQISAIVLCVVYIICAYVTYRVIDYIYKQYVDNDPTRLMEKKARLYKDDVKREVEMEMAKINREAILGGVKIARVITMALIMGSFLIAAAAKIPTIALPRGAALESVLEAMKDATKVEIVQQREKSHETRDDSVKDRRDRDAGRSESGSEQRDVPSGVRTSDVGDDRPER